MHTRTQELCSHSHAFELGVDIYHTRGRINSIRSSPEHTYPRVQLPNLMLIHTLFPFPCRPFELEAVGVRVKQAPDHTMATQLKIVGNAVVRRVAVTSDVTSAL